MSYILIEDFKAGLDRRRLIETSAPGTLWECKNAHINRGGEIEKAKSFVSKYSLSAGETFGLAVASGQLYVFGNLAEVALGTALPAGVEYQQLVGTTAQDMNRILDYDVFDGKIYAVAEYTDGTVDHFYDASIVSDWFDGKARASFEVQPSTEVAEVAATGSIEVTAGTLATVAATGSIDITGGTNSAGVNTIDSITVNSVDVLGSSIDHTGDDTTTAAAVAAQITSNTSSPNYTATNSGPTITITADDGGTGPNGYVVASTESGDVTTGSAVAMNGGSFPSGVNSVDTVTVNGVDILGSAVDHTGDHSTTATAVAAQITSNTSSPNYTATAALGVITITAADAGSAPNGFAVSHSKSGDVTLANAANMASGVDANAVTSITVNGVEILNTAVPYTTDPQTTAEDISDQINSFTSSPEYTATFSGSVVNIISATAGVGPNGFVVTITDNNVNLSTNSTVMAGGAAASGTFQPGTFAKTIKSKMYSVSGSLFHYSAVDDPTDWSTGIGSGFINMSNEASGSEELTAIENYFTNVAIFAKNNIQIWFLDVDDSLNSQLQVLRNTGTVAPRSVEAFGDSDVFYLARSGIRSLKARDSSNAASVSDVGTAIDPLIVSELLSLSASQIASSSAVIEPLDGRYLLAINSKVYVFSFFSSSKISAWSTYEPGFSITEWAVVESKLYARSGDTVYLYGGDSGLTYDDTEAEVIIPFLDAQKPATMKLFDGLDMACRGEWVVSFGTREDDITTFDPSSVTVEETTYGKEKIPINQTGTHLAMKLTTSSESKAVIGNITIHFDSAGSE